MRERPARQGVDGGKPVSSLQLRIGNCECILSVRCAQTPSQSFVRSISDQSRSSSAHPLSYPLSLSLSRFPSVCLSISDALRIKMTPGNVQFSYRGGVGDARLPRHIFVSSFEFQFASQRDPRQAKPRVSFKGKIGR